MNGDKKSLRDISRVNWFPGNAETPSSTENIQLGATLRIADALERIATALEVRNRLDSNVTVKISGIDQLQKKLRREFNKHVRETESPR